MKPFRSEDEEFLKDWMRLSQDRLNSTRLVDLVIPGTHNSNTFTFKTLISPFVRNQKLSIREQLLYGVRYLDLRYGYSKGQFVDKHGVYSGTKSFIKHFETVKTFL